MARLIDTSVFIALERSEQPLYALESIVADGSFALASITASELLVGVYQAVADEHRQRRRMFVETVLNGLSVLPFDIEVARTHARLFANLAMVGRQIGSNDLLIAATALTYGFDIVTHNLRHFERVPGLVVHRPEW
jgi:tRNA(fMet)-specific endonuclease VapC